MDNDWKQFSAGISNLISTLGAEEKLLASKLLRLTSQCQEVKGQLDQVRAKQLV